MGRYFGAPDIAGPKVRAGIFWFLLALAAVTSGRWWTAALWSAVAFFAAYQMVLAWARARSTAEVGALQVLPIGLLAGVGAVAVTATAGYGTGLAGVALSAISLTCGIAVLAAGPLRGPVGSVVLGVLAPAIAAAAVVITVRVDLWAGLFLVLAVSLYDAGAFVFGAESTGRWEGPVCGVIGVLAVTFTVSTIKVPLFDRAEAWIAGVALAAGCVLGQAAAAALLPDPASRAPALRRLDAYLVAGPAFLACTWLMGT